MSNEEETKKIHSAWLCLFVSIGAFWRAWFGGSFGYCWRWVKYIVCFAIVLAMYWSKGLLNYKEILTSWKYCVDNWRIFAVCLSFIYHFARSHGDYFKVNNTDPDEARIKWIDFLLQKIYGKGNYYNWRGNVTGLFFRYTSTACLVAVAVPSIWAISMGPVVAMSYGLIGKFFPKSYYTKWAEYIGGGSCFGILWGCV